MKIPPLRFVAFSLRWKILAWFFVNLAVVSLALFGFLWAQFGLGIDSLLAGPTGDRLEAIARPLAIELRRLPVSAWNETLARAVGPYQQNGDEVRAAIVASDGTVLAGGLPALPDEVRRTVVRPGGGGRGGGGHRPDGRPPMPPAGDEFPPPDGPGRGEPPPEFPSREEHRPGPMTPPSTSEETRAGPMRKFMLGTTSPRLYWAGVFLGDLSPATLARSFPGTPPRFGILLLASPSLRGGGLFFDYSPWLILGGGLALLSVLLWLPFVSRITRGLKDMTRTAEHIADGDFRPPTRGIRRRDELGRLSRALGHMAARLEGLVTGQKRFLGDTAHELLSPLGRLEVSLSILEQRAAPGDQEMVGRALGEVHHLAGLVQDLLHFTKSELGAVPVALRSVPLRNLAQAVAAREASGKDVQVNIPLDLCALADPDLLGRALGNAVRNAVRYAGDAGPITVFAASPSESRAEVSLTVADQGPGVPADALERLFDPFFRPDTARTRETGGTGLGLAIVKSCVEACGGTVSARNRTAAGLALVFRLRRA